MKKELMLSALLMSQPLLPFASQAFAADNGTDLSHVRADTSLNLVSEGSVKYRGVSYQVNGMLEMGSFEDRSGDDNKPKVFDLQGTFFLNGKNDKNLQLGDGGDTDGAMVFEKISEDTKTIKYRGYSCSSSYTGCSPEEAGDIVLEYNKDDGSYSLSVDLRRPLQGWDHGGNFEANTPLLFKNLKLTNQPKAAR